MALVLALAPYSGFCHCWKLASSSWPGAEACGEGAGAGLGGRRKKGAGGGALQQGAEDSKRSRKTPYVFQFVLVSRACSTR